MLLVAGLLRAHDERGQAVIPRELERKAIGKTLFKVESATVSTAQRIQIRKLLQKVEIAARQGEELGSVPPFLQHMMDLADKAGGEAPKPARPDTTSLDDIRLASGNEQLLASTTGGKSWEATLIPGPHLAGALPSAGPAGTM